MAYRQNPSKLFDILPSPELNLAEYVTVSWERPKPTGIPSDAPSRPSDAVLAKFCQVRKAKVLAALEWLCLHNPLYKDVKINRELLAIWKESFIPEILITSAIITDRKLSDNRDGYVYDRDADTTEFGARATEQEEVIYEDDNDEILSDQIEFNGVHEEAGKENLDGSVTVPHIEYKQAFGIETFNSWTDYNYLLAAFPTVFPYGRGGHVQADRAKRPISVDLQEYANWLMRHHNCQAAKHHILPYVLYDMILLRQSSTGNIVQSRNEYWAHGQVDIMSLTSEDLQRAAKEMAAGGRCSNLVINRLLVNVRLVSSYNPESFGKKLAMRHVLMGHVVLHGAPAFWFTINPTDLNSPLVLRMAGVHVTPHLTKAQLSDLRRRSAMGNLGLVAQYFDNVIQSFFKHLLCSATEKVGILGPIVSHFGVVETNARKMYYLYGFAWLAGNIDFDKLGVRVIRSPDFRNRLASYLTSVVTEQIDLAWGERYREEYPDR
ncbi:hypothetical protein L207DRAFT_585483 [Hyaloscypha variabilis F]|uniref:Uncharacterized protein n=1 Tax=Hyaloscypha variabilis (strain UAMH 11265 / GT02V1 / F) TaxID=1149755 RepID=A0A2J6RF47_HYAVF|nr:hypothetical protein L207DRAFT_585483 [Hyaloscypha variabilis F]